MSTTITIEIDGQPHQSADASLSGRRIKELRGHLDGRLLKLEADDERFVADEEVLDLRGGEQFTFECEVEEHRHHQHRRKRIVIEVDGKPYETRRHELTGAEIKALAHKPPGNLLYRITAERQRVEIGDTQPVHLHDGEKFVTTPPVGHAS